MTPDQKRDKIFQTQEIQEDFVFNDRVVEVFDDMLDRSVPFYDQVISATAALLDHLLEDGDSVIDLGCATGNTLIELARALPEKSLHYTGVDTSAAMLEKASRKSEMYGKSDLFHFRQEDITSSDHHNVGCFLVNYTMQFIRPLKRHSFIRRLYENLRPGGVVIISEKTILDDSRLNRTFIDLYHDFKRQKGYSELEIAKKREALENVLIPFSVDENVSMLREAGFTPVQPFFQWLNFSSFIGIKPM